MQQLTILLTLVGTVLFLGFVFTNSCADWPETETLSICKD